MNIALPIHLVTVIVWLGGLFGLSVAFRPSTRDPQSVSRLFRWASISLALIVASGVALVQLRFGGYSGTPLVHRLNMAIGLPAIGAVATLSSGGRSR
jgi:uncharacterized membrane protein